MLKTIFSAGPTDGGREPGGAWFRAEDIKEIGVTSENKNAPIENVFDATTQGWRADVAGSQLIRITFNEPKSIRRIQVEFVEEERERTQEFKIHWSGGLDRTMSEVIRQQWTFSSAGSTRELEDYAVTLEGVLLLDLIIQPDIGHSGALASLKSLRIG